MSNAANEYVVQVVNFSTGPRYARQLGGTFDPRSKTWTLPQSEKADRYLSAPGAYGLKVLARPTNAATDVRDPYMGQMCPRCHTVCYGDCRS